MAVSAAKVKAVCTAAEIELVRASRKPALQRLTATELTRYVTRARKLADKWDNQGRKQVRSRSPKAGMTDRDANTALKAEIFRDALNAFSAQLAALEAANATGGPQKVRLSKSRRAASHRASRSDARKEIAEQKRSIAAKAPKVGAGAKAASDKANTAAPPAKAAVAKKKAGVKKAAPPKAVASKSAAKKAKVGAAAGMTAAKQRKVTTAAKKARLAASGKAGRIQGHVVARGRRAQAARDARN